MPVTFISYRREDSGGQAGRLYDRLRERFGQDRVFLDVVGIEAGVDFVESIDKAVGSCEVLLAVIGQEWLTCTDRQGRRRLDDPNDFIRAEIKAALDRDVRVVPVLVQCAEMPATDALPDDLKRLTRRQAVELRDSRWDADVEDLIEVLEKLEKPTAATAGSVAPVPPAQKLPVGVPPAGSAEEGRATGRRGLLWGIGALVLALVAVGIGLALRQGGEPSRPPEVQEPQASEPAPLPVQETQAQIEPEPVKPDPEPVKPEPEPEPEPAPADTRVAVPDVVGKDIRQIGEVVRSAGLTYSREPAASRLPKYQVVRQEPAAGSRVEKGTKVTLFYSSLSSRVPDRAPAEATRTVVFIHYADAADQRTAERLATYLRGLGLPVAEYKVSLNTRGLASTGKLQYYSEGQADLARTIAGRSGSWLSRTYDRRVSIQPDLPTPSGRTSLVLWMPGS